MVPKNSILVSMDVANIPQEEEINIVCNANIKQSTETNLKLYMTTAKSAHTYLSEELLPTYWKTNYLQIHGTATGTKMAVAFPNIFMAKVDTEISIQSTLKPLF